MIAIANRYAAITAALAVTLCGFCTTTCAQGFPDRPVHILVGFAPGGAADTIARTLSQALAEQTGQPFIVENRPGAGGSLALEAALRAPADGYTVAAGGLNNPINATLSRNVGFDLGRDFSMLTLTAAVPNILVVHPSVPATNVLEFIEYVKANPGRVNFASSGAGSSIHLSGELFNSIAGVSMTHVPYKGSGPAMADLLGGHVQAMFDNAPSALPHVRSGKLRALAVTTATRSPSAPDIPTMAEAGLPGFEVTSWFSVYVPARVPRAVALKLNAEFVRALESPAVREKFAAMGAQPVPMSLDEANAYMRSEIDKWAIVIKSTGAVSD